MEVWVRDNHYGSGQYGNDSSFISALRYESEDETSMIVCAAICVLLLLSLCANLIATIAIATNRRLQTSTNYYELSTFIFITIILIILVWMATFHLSGHAMAASTLSHFNEAALKSLNVFIVLHETTKIVERYFGLSQPLHSRIKSLKSRAVKRSVCIWILTGVVNLPLIMCSRSTFHKLPTIPNDNYEDMLPTGNTERDYNEELESTLTSPLPIESEIESTMSIYSANGESSFTFHAMCAAYSSLSPYLDFSFLYIMPLLLNGIFFGITVRQLRNVCDGISSKSRSWKISKTTGIRYKIQKCQPLTVSEIQSSGTTSLRLTNYPTALTTVTLQSANAAKDCKEFNQMPTSDIQANPRLRNHLYTMIFPSITFLTQQTDVEIISRRSSTVHDRVFKNKLKKQISTDSAASCATTTSALSDDLPNKPPSNTACRPLTRMSSVVTDSERQSLKPTKLWKNRIRAVKNLALTTIVFGIKWLPYHIAKIYIANNETQCINTPCHGSSFATPTLVKYIEMCWGFLVFIVTISSPILLCICSKPFANAFIRILTCGKCRKRERRHPPSSFGPLTQRNSTALK